MEELEITKETFEKMSSDDQLRVIFDIVKGIHNDVRLMQTQLDKKNKIVTTMAIFLGFIGGLAAKWLV